MDQIHTDYLEYSYKGMVSGSKNPTDFSGNTSLYTAEMLYILKDNNSLVTQDWADYLTNVTQYCEVQPGLLKRTPTNNDQEGPDDYIGVAAGSTFTGSLAQDILAYGRKNYFSWGPFKFPYYYQNETPGNQKDVRAWIGRFPQVIAHIQYCAGETPALWKRLAWFISVAVTGLFKSTDTQDSWRLSYLLVRAAPKRLSTSFASWIFYHRLKNKYGSMRSIYATYFNDANHPHSKWSKY